MLPIREMTIVGADLAAPADLSDLLASSVERQPDGTALIARTEAGTVRWTWRTLEEKVEGLARRFAAIGLRPGDRVASLMPNTAELLLHYLGALRAGLVVAPLNYRYTPAEIDYALSTGGASVLVAHAEHADDVRASRRAGDLAHGVLAFGGAIDDAPRWESWVDGPAPDVELKKPDPAAPAFLFFTSGSTGKPKGVTHSLRSFGSIAASFASVMKLSADDVVLPGSSMSHVGALAATLSGLSVGARVLVSRTFDGDGLLPWLREERPSVLLTLPSNALSLANHADASPDDFRSLRLCLTSGDKFPSSLRDAFTANTGKVVREVYGLTEATNCLFDGSAGAAKAGSVGTVSPGYAASLRDDEGREVPVGTDGNLWVSGTPVMLGYWNDPQATDSAIVDGWLDTGDVMRVDDDGYFWFRGRKKQMIVHDGSNVSPQEVEEALMAHPAIALAGVVGVRDVLHGENVWAFVTVREGSEPPEAEEIIQLAREQIGYKAPEVVLFLDEMPMNVTGKVDRVTLARWAAEGTVQ